MSFVTRWAAKLSRFRVLRQLYQSVIKENSPEEKGRTLLRQWLTSPQRSQFERLGYFEVVGCATQKRYRVQYGCVANVQEIDLDGQAGDILCFAPEGNLVPGDVMLAQKIALETDELGALAAAHRFVPLAGRLNSVQSWT